jgi:spore germination cell wall hydrolase CwlJ-like protein
MVIPSRSYGYRASEKERECLARAMFFESNRSSRDGLVAVGSVVMNRRDSGKWGDNICDVVGAKRQFAPGVLSRKMNSKALPDVMAAADAVLKGERHPKVSKDVMFFHTAGLKFPYKNMRYTTVAGGNAFYYKAGRKQDRLPVKQDDSIPGMQPVMVATAEQPKAEASGLPGVGAETIEAAAPVQVAYAGDTPTVKKPVRTSLFGKRKAQPAEQARAPQAEEQAPRAVAEEQTQPTAEGQAQPAEEFQVALADEAPIPADRVEPQSERQQAAFAQPVSEPAPAKLSKKIKAKRQQPAAVQASAAAEPPYDAPSEERFGGAMPAYSDTGLSYGDGTGTGILGQLSIQGN